jgi:hypothetical protein
MNIGRSGIFGRMRGIWSMEFLFQFLDRNRFGFPLFLTIFIDEDGIQDGKLPGLAVSSWSEIAKSALGAQVGFLNQVVVDLIRTSQS